MKPEWEVVTENPSVAEVVRGMVRLSLEAKDRAEIRAVATEICRDLQSGDHNSEIVAILEWVRKNIRYMRDTHDTELVTWPTGVIEAGCGDCDDMATLLAALLMSAGQPCNFCLVSFDHTQTPSHVFCSAPVPGGDVVLDPVAGAVPEKMLADVTQMWVIPVAEPVILPASLSQGWNGWSGWAGGH